MHSLCTAVCPYAFYTVALDHMEAGKASILCSCEPVAAMVFGFFFFGAIPHNSKCRYGERGAADAKPKAQIILDAAKVSAASGGNSEPKQGQRSQSARGFCPRSTMRVPQPDIIEHFGNADAVPQPPERSLSRKAGIVWCCLREIPTVPSIAGLIIVLIALAMLVLSDKKQEVVEE
ncbi:MAG: hypothetical protein ACLTZH_06300 [Subdoligranulum sp.]